MMREDFKAAMRQWQTGICLVTSVDPNGTPVGLVCNSFSSLSLDPPLISWAVDHASTAIDSWRAASSYALHVLPYMEKPLDHPLIARFSQRGGDKFTDLAYEHNECGNPVFPEIPTRFDCVVHRRLTIGDHDLMVGSPTTIHHPGTQLLPASRSH